MPSIGHVFVGMAAGRAYLPKEVTKSQLVKAMVGLSIVSVLPDADAIAFAFGIPYSDILGHRGWTHSLGFAVLAGLVGVAIAPLLKQPRWRLTLFCFLTAFSHGLLDTFTTGGLGCALFWPFTARRFFFPPHIIPVAPIGLAMFSPRGLLVVCAEIVLFLPVFLYATFPRKRAAKS
jgi:inner membrane protein